MSQMRLPSNVDWRYWVKRFDNMQRRYLVRWEERLAVITRLVQDTQDKTDLVIGLGCGVGSLTERVLETFKTAKVIAIDFDPTLLLLAESRLAKFGRRVRIVQEDLRQQSWTDCIEGKADAVVSATTLHWFSAEQLAVLYRQLADILKPGGMFLNADHVASESSAIQKSWEQHRQAMRREEDHGHADSWSEFFQAYAEALDMDVDGIRQKIIGQWVAVEEGLPLAWHFDQLRECGFSSVDCFWRCDCDAVYGAIRG